MVLDEVQTLYRIRLEHALRATYEIAQRTDGHPRTRESALVDAIEMLRVTDEAHLTRVRDLQKSFIDAWTPHDREVIGKHRHEVRDMLSQAACLVVAGGHVGELLHVLCLRHVGANPQRLPPACADLRNHRVEGVILHVSQHQLHPLVRGDAREFASESAARAGDDGDLAGEILHRRLLARSITTAAALGQAIGLPVSLCGTAFGDRLRT